MSRIRTFILFVTFTTICAVGDNVAQADTTSICEQGATYTSSLVGSYGGTYNSAAALAGNWGIAGEDFGNCSLGVRQLLTAQGIPIPASGGSAYMYGSKLDNLPGWHRADCGGPCTPLNAPEGAVLVYNHNNPQGTHGHGAQHGHVEVVSLTSDGSRRYVSDYVGTHYGGSVPNNFMGAWVYTGN